MRRLVMWAMSTLTVLVLLFGYHTSTSSRMSAAQSAAIAPISGGDAASGAAAATGSSSAGSSSAGSGSAGTGGTSGGSTGSTSSGATGSTSGAATTVTGSVAQTRWGPVQVELTVTGGRITDVSVVQYPHENGKDQQINSRALPVLIDETLSAQSASIDMVSGATVTSEGYVQSLQSALDRAGL